MGQAIMGSSAKQTGKADLMTPQQKQFLNSLLGSVGGDVQGAFPGLLQGFSEENFQKGVVDPTMKTYQNQVLPGIEQRFTDANAGSSSALNQALVQSSEDLSNTLGGQRINYQQMMGQQQLGALSQIMSLLGARSFDPIVQGPQKGLLADTIGAVGSLGSAYMMSSRKVKDNVVDYPCGLDVVSQMHVKQYDYIVPVEGPQRGRVGLIAEDLPSELTAEINGIKVVDLYGLVATLVNAVKDLNEKVKSLGG